MSENPANVCQGIQEPQQVQGAAEATPHQNGQGGLSFSGPSLHGQRAAGVSLQDLQPPQEQVQAQRGVYPDHEDQKDAKPIMKLLIAVAHRRLASFPQPLKQLQQHDHHGQQQ